MLTVSIEEARNKLDELIHNLALGENIVLTKNEQPVAQLTKLVVEQPRPILGRCEGFLTILSEDDEHLEDWANYMP